MRWHVIFSFSVLLFFIMLFFLYLYTVPHLLKIQSVESNCEQALELSNSYSNTMSAVCLDNLEQCRPIGV